VPSPIEDFTSRLLARHGALVERDENEIVAVMPPVLASMLEVAEYQRFTFDRRAATGHAIVVDYDSPLVDRFGRVVEELGRVAVMPAPRLALKTIDPEAAIADAITFHNGVVRDCRVESGRATYVGFVIQHELLSDERVSGMSEVWVNTTTHSAPRLVGVIEMLLVTSRNAECNHGLEEGPPDDLSGTVAEAWRLGAALARHAVENRLQESIESLRRRREREFIRLREYYQAIDEEIRGRVRRALLKGDDRAATAEASRLEATVRAYRARITDLVDRYRARVRLRPLAVLACTLPVRHVHARLHRRTASRTSTFAWNPIDRAIEPPCCEACGIAASTVTLCDDRVHLLCTGCGGCCETCARPYCRACHERCPRRH
jgi:hypothetical protein